MNHANFHQKTNYIASSDKFENIPFYLVNVNIPGMNFSHPEIGGRASTKMKLSPDTVDFNSLSFEMLIDEDFEIYKEFIGIINKNINIKTGIFADFTFDFYIEISNNKGAQLFKLEFSNCRIESIGDIMLDSTDESTEHTLSVEVAYDYYQMADNVSLINVVN